jgi:hypothetical protein
MALNKSQNPCKSLNVYHVLSPSATLSLFKHFLLVYNGFTVCFVATFPHMSIMYPGLVHPLLHLLKMPSAGLSHL